MTAWRVGRATITPIIEVETVTSPRFLFKDLDKAGVLDVARRSPWLQGAFVDDGGYLLQRIQCLVVDLDGVRVAVDTCVGNDKPRANPGWNELHLPFLADLEAAGFPLTRSTRWCARTCTSTTSAGTRCSSTASGCRPSRAPRYLLAQPEFEYWQATTIPDGDDYFSDSVAPLGEAGVVDLVRRRPCRRRGHPLRLDARPHSGSCVGRRRVRRRARHHHRRHDPHAVADRRGRPLLGVRLRSAGGGRDPRELPGALRRTTRWSSAPTGVDRAPGASLPRATAGLSIPSLPRKSARWVDLPDHVAQALGVGVVGTSRVHGGDVAASFAIELADGRRVFAKTHPNAPNGFFTTEAAGLRWLREPGVVPVPEVLAVSDDPPYLVLEWIEEGRPRRRRTESARSRARSAARGRRGDVRPRGPSLDGQSGPAERAVPRLGQVLRDPAAGPARAARS